MERPETLKSWDDLVEAYPFSIGVIEVYSAPKSTTIPENFKCANSLRLAVGTRINLVAPMLNTASAIYCLPAALFCSLLGSATMTAQSASKSPEGSPLLPPAVKL
jgi:hypothetical protein